MDWEQVLDMVLEQELDLVHGQGLSMDWEQRF